MHLFAVIAVLIIAASLGHAATVPVNPWLIRSFGGDVRAGALAVDPNDNVFALGTHNYYNAPVYHINGSSFMTITNNGSNSYAAHLFKV